MECFYLNRKTIPLPVTLHRLKHKTLRRLYSLHVIDFLSTSNADRAGLNPNKPNFNISFL